MLSPFVCEYVCVAVRHIRQHCWGDGLDDALFVQNKSIEIESDVFAFANARDRVFMKCVCVRICVVCFEYVL